MTRQIVENSSTGIKTVPSIIPLRDNLILLTAKAKIIPKLFVNL
jgi:hypothetical protein